ncbi:hypothetical protein ACQKHB_23005 [Escherichia coli]|uniref:hypothetical protein n=1 Tax=Escherichia coli TaxID=562 RepID=UPI003CFC7075
MSIELNGQGTPLPNPYPYSGYWILEPRLFLYLSHESDPIDPTSPRFTADVNPNTDDWAIGFDARVLAEAFYVTPTDIFVANSSHELKLINVKANTLNGENATEKRYIFEAFGSQISIVVQVLGSSGSA